MNERRRFLLEKLYIKEGIFGKIAKKSASFATNKAKTNVKQNLINRPASHVRRFS
jgi:hypothetical protein